MVGVRVRIGKLRLGRVIIKVIFCKVNLCDHHTLKSHHLLLEVLEQPHLTHNGNCCARWCTHHSHSCSDHRHWHCCYYCYYYHCCCSCLHPTQ